MRPTAVGLAILAVAIPALAFQGAARPDAGWTSDLAKAQATAKKTGKIVLVDFNATWCGPCQMYRHEVFPTAEFKTAAKNAILVSIDVDRQPALAAKFGVRGIPDIRIIAPSGKVVGGMVGYGGAKPLVAEIAKAQKAAKK